MSNLMIGLILDIFYNRIFHKKGGHLFEDKPLVIYYYERGQCFCEITHMD